MSQRQKMKKKLHLLNIHPFVAFQPSRMRYELTRARRKQGWNIDWHIQRNISTEGENHLPGVLLCQVHRCLQKVYRK